MEGVVDGHAVIVGRPALLADWTMHLPAELEEARRAAEARGQTAVAAGWDGRAAAIFVVADTVKETSAEAVAARKTLGLRPVLLTGDNEATARAVANPGTIDQDRVNAQQARRIIDRLVGYEVSDLLWSKVWRALSHSPV